MVAPKQPRSMHTASLLANVQQDLEILFTSTSESILLIEANGIILAANDVSAKWLDRSAESLTGENLFLLLTPSGIPIREWVHEAVSKKTIHESDALFGERFIHVRSIPITSGDKVRRLIIIGQDVTEHKQAEKQVREFTGQMELKVRERTKELEALNQKLAEDKRRAEIQASLSHHLMQDTQDYEHLLEHITTTISDLIGDTCLIALFTTDLTFMEVQAITDRDIESLTRQRTQLLNRTISVEGNAIANSILKGERYSAKEITKEMGRELLPPEFALQLGEQGLIALEVFPLQVGNHPLGMLAIGREHGIPYSEDEISFVGSLIGSIALAIQNAHLFEQLTESQTQLRGLSQQLVQMQENQYRHLAKELHDRVGQDMTAININLNIIQTLLPQTISKDVISRLADTEKLVQESVARMRSIMAEFRPPMLDQYGLAAALYWYSEQYTRRTNIAVKVDDQYLKDTRLPSELEIALFRIAQEALNNVAKHAKASQVNIELLESQGNILMTVTDDGVGFDTKKPGASSPAHWGVTNMRERARAINGEFLLRSVPGQGTQIAVRVRKTQ
ncbi:MAG: PAS domain-containing protein [Anaerolineales bacterium]|nr:PAS domain-containing protein [Anaerolineales bacterium]